MNQLVIHDANSFTTLRDTAASAHLFSIVATRFPFTLSIDEALWNCRPRAPPDTHIHTYNDIPPSLPIVRPPTVLRIRERAKLPIFAAQLVTGTCFVCPTLCWPLLLAVRVVLNAQTISTSLANSEEKRYWTRSYVQPSGGVVVATLSCVN